MLFSVVVWFACLGTIGSAGGSRVAWGIGCWQLWIWWVHQQVTPVQRFADWKCWYFFCLFFVV